MVGRELLPGEGPQEVEVRSDDVSDGGIPVNGSQAVTTHAGDISLGHSREVAGLTKDVILGVHLLLQQECVIEMR